MVYMALFNFKIAFGVDFVFSCSRLHFLKKYKKVKKEIP